MYKLIKNIRTQQVDVVNKIEDGFMLSIPFDEANTDYQAYLKFLEEGGQPLPADEVSGE
jgi:Tfp pilus assembly protein PilZ